MKKILLIIPVCLCTCSLFAQRHLYMGVFGGLTGYKGDLGSATLPFKAPNGVIGGSMVVELNHRMIIRAELNYGEVSGSDKLSAKNRARNLDFSSKITEAGLAFEYILFDLYEYKVSPYFFAGISTFKFSPYTKDEKGNVIFLAELSTEGQGFYKDRKEYKLQKIAIPFGGGFQWALSRRTRLLLEAGIRKTNTDYLDDVSTTYVDATLLEQRKGATAVAIAYRGDELDPSSPYPAADTRRGNPANKDWYFFTGLHFRFSLEPKMRQVRYTYKPRRAKTSCPTVF
ncbi:MAG: DUF6089 family protein [Ferruginibacter sp.]